MTWWLWLCAGVVLTHVLYALIFAGAALWLLRGDRTPKAITETFDRVRDAVHEPQKRRHSDVHDTDPHRW